MMINFSKITVGYKQQRNILNSPLMEEKIVLGTGMAIWVFIAVYILIETRKKVKLLAEKHRVSYPFQCPECQHIKHYTYSQYMEIVKRPTNQLKTFSKVRNQYLIHCDECQKNTYQEIVYQKIPLNPQFEKERQKILIFFLVKGVVLGLSVSAILGLSGILEK
jgi:transcription elongation factor Elf1